jgi:hypothetical protein
MPQLDLDLLEDFLFFAFVALLLGFGDDEAEENAVNRHADAHLASFYLTTRKALRAETDLLAKAPRVALQNPLGIFPFLGFFGSISTVETLPSKQVSGGSIPPVPNP